MRSEFSLLPSRYRNTFCDKSSLDGNHDPSITTRFVIPERRVIPRWHEFATVDIGLEPTFNATMISGFASSVIYWNSSFNLAGLSADFT